MRTNMKTIQLLTAITVATLTLAACSEEEKLLGDNWDGRIHLSSSVATLTRNTYNLDKQIGKDVNVWLYIDKTDGNQIDKATLTADGSGNFSGDNNLYYPASETSINLYALHMNSSSATSIPDNYPASEQTHSVESNQTTPTGGGSNTPSNYAKSDLIYAKVTGKTKDAVRTANGTIELEFTHLLSKIEVVLKKDASLGSDIDISKVEILNTILSGTFTPNKSSDFSVTVASGAGVSTAAIEIDKDVTSGDTEVLNEAIIIPQTVDGSVNGGLDFIKVTLSTGGTLVYKLTSSTAFAAKTKYKYTITAKLTGLEVTSKITEWTYNNANDVTGEAGM